MNLVNIKPENLIGAKIKTTRGSSFRGVTFFEKGDIGTVMAIDEDGDLVVKFNPSPTVNYSTLGVWFVSPRFAEFYHD